MEKTDVLPLHVRICKSLQYESGALSNGCIPCDFQQCGILTSEDSGEPVKPPFKPRNSKFCAVSSLTVIEYSSD